jgi:hypothetical protein
MSGRRPSLRAGEAPKTAPEAPALLLSPRAWLVALFLLLFLLLYAWLPGTGPWFANVVRGVGLVYANREVSDDVRGKVLMGEAFSLVREAERTTPAGSRILIPSGSDYDPLSNRVWASYYLYPRRVLQERDLAGRRLEDAADYVLIYRGWYLTEAGFPADSTMNGILEVASLRSLERSGAP